LDDHFLNECRLTAATEKDRISQQFKSIAFMAMKKSSMELYFRQHQVGLTNLADITFSYLQLNGPESIYLITPTASMLDFYQEMARIPEALLHCIEINFSEYFDMDMKIPDAKRWLMIPEILHTLKLEKKESKETEVPEDLIKITCSVMEDFLIPEKNINYHELAYLKGFQRGIHYFSERKDKIPGDEQKCQLLVFLNFNSLQFLNFFTQQFKEKEKSCTTNTERIVYYYLQLKIISQLPMKPGLIFNTGLPSIKDQIISWIYDEINYLEKEEQLLPYLPTEMPMEQMREEKVQTSLSVSQLSLAVKLLMDTKVISHHNSTEVMRMVARNFRTERRDTISEASLRNKSYSYDSGTVDKMKEVIKGFMNMMREY
jgi:hypothetical protein